MQSVAFLNWLPFAAIKEHYMQILWQVGTLFFLNTCIVAFRLSVYEIIVEHELFWG